MIKYFTYIFSLFFILNPTIHARTYDILALGDLIIDHTCPLSDEELAKETDRLGGSERIDEEKLATLNTNYQKRCSHYPGGSSANIMKTLAELGHSGAIFGRLGSDHWSEFFIREMKKHHLDIYYTRVNGPSPQSFCLLNSQGDRTMLSFFSNSHTILNSDIDEDCFNDTKLLHLEGYNLFHKEALYKCIALAEKENACISLSMGSYQVIDLFKSEFISLINNHVDILFANKDEAYALTGLENPLEAALKMSDWCKIVVVHNGEEGGFVAFDDKFIKYNAFKVEKIVDTTGAGDYFASGFLHAYLNKKPLYTCALSGAFLGAEIVKFRGTNPPKNMEHSLNKIFDQYKFQLNPEESNPK